MPSIQFDNVATNCTCIVCAQTYVKFRARVVFIAAGGDVDYGFIARGIGAKSHNLLWNTRQFAFIYFMTSVIKAACEKVHNMDVSPIRISVPPMFVNHVWRMLQDNPLITTKDECFKSVLFDANAKDHQQNACGV